MISDWSQSFTVIGPVTCKITQPTSTTKWAAGPFQAVQWTCQYNPDNDRMYLSIWRNGLPLRNWTSVPCHDGANSVVARLFPDLTPGTGYQVQMNWMRRWSVYVRSQPFEVTTRPTCVITNPTGTTRWGVGTPGTVQWTCVNNPNQDRMYLSLWRGNTGVRNWTSVPCQNGSNSVTVGMPSGLTPATDYRIRMSWMRDFSDYCWSPTFTVY